MLLDHCIFILNASIMVASQIFQNTYASIQIHNPYPVTNLHLFIFLFTTPHDGRL
jgi:hypothetical protein